MRDEDEEEQGQRREPKDDVACSDASAAAAATAKFLPAQVSGVKYAHSHFTTRGTTTYDQ